jgi:hypothetical protein
LHFDRHPASDGVFVFVLQGQLKLPEHSLAAWEMFFISRGEPLPECMAGEQGAQILTLHCPPKESAYKDVP